ncbi:TonB-dependent receptor plug domain-containing protein [Alteromonas facilis]|uniref:TonB-dependent receptor plug domain-containing protein n=1 Tax=Alteromonas facilis TaxID=2048004 RepID=UPI000C28CA77|nr:TonB-dependent receptor [Alteromonas facilis]
MHCSKRAVLLVTCATCAAHANAQSRIDSLLSLSLEELRNIEISVASNVVTTLREQPTSITTISADTIRLSGARTLNELLTLYVPGYFQVEDQDDTIAGFRGVVPDNNSKTMLLLNGQNLNTEWFWGAPDTILNGVDLELIERIEVIRGPGSVTLGQGALLGVINIVTKQSLASGSSISVKAGENGFIKLSADFRYKNEDTSAYAFLSKGEYDGQHMPNVGWARTRVDQGLSVFERNHRIRRNEHQSLFANVKHKQFELDVFHFEQTRDLYNFYRDREVVEQSIQGISGHYNYTLNDNIKIKFSANYTKDDYQLFSHGGNIGTANRYNFESTQSQFSSFVQDGTFVADSFVTPGLVMGGTGEVRQGLKLLVNWEEPLPNHRVAFGAEYVNYDYGNTNSEGNNYILNEEIQLLGFSSNGAGGFIHSNSLNESNTWVKPDSVQIKSLFVEDLYQFNKQLDFFGAFRFDDHPNWGSQLSPRLGALYDINGVHLIRFTWQTGFRGAVGVQYSGGFVQDGLLAQSNFDIANELAVLNADFNFDGIVGNDLKTLTPVEPETIESFEISYQYSQERWQINGVAFYNTVEDILAADANAWIGFVFGDKIGTDDIGTWGGNWYYQNQSGKLTQRGLELEVSYQMDNLMLRASHANVGVVNADPGVIGGYVLDGNNVAAYPENISRFHLNYHTSMSSGDFSLQYEHVRYWRYHAPTGATVNGGHIANLGMALRFNSVENLEVGATIKNVWNEDALYPINGTGDLLGADGTPSIEKRTWWLTANYQF